MRDYFRFARSHRRLLAFGFALTFFSSFGQTFFLSLFSAEIRRDFALSHGGFGSLYSLATLGSGLSMLWLGRQIDRHDLRRFTLAVCGALIASAFFMAMVPTRTVLVLALFAMRLTGQGLMGHTAATSMARYFGRGRGKAISIATMGFPAGEATLPAIAVAIDSRIGWRATWVGVGGLLAVTLVPLVLRFLRGHEERHEAYLEGRAVDDSPGDAGGARRGDDDWTQGQVLRDTRFWIAAPAVVAAPFLMTGFFFHQVHLVETKGWDLQWYTLCFTGFAASQLASTLLAGPLVDRLGAARLLPLLPLPLALALMVLAVFRNPASAPVYLALAGLSAGSASPITGALWAEAYGTAHLGAIRAMVTTLFVLSTAASPVIMGDLIDRGLSMEALAGMGAGYVVLAALGGAVAFRGGVRRAPSGRPRP